MRKFTVDALTACGVPHPSAVRFEDVLYDLVDTSEDSGDSVDDTHYTHIVSECINTLHTLQTKGIPIPDDVSVLLSIDHRELFGPSFTHCSMNLQDLVKLDAARIDATMSIGEKHAIQTHAVSRCRNPKCRSNDVDVYEKQTRSADEPMTSFYTCRKCNTKWKE